MTLVTYEGMVYMRQVWSYEHNCKFDDGNERKVPDFVVGQTFTNRRSIMQDFFWHK